MELDDGRNPRVAPRAFGTRAPRDLRLAPLLPQLLHPLLLHGVLGLGPLAEGNRLDGPPRHQHAPGHDGHRRGVAQHAASSGLLRRGGRTLHSRSGIPGLVADEQPRRVGRPQPRAVVRRPRGAATPNPGAYALLRHGTGAPRIFGDGTPRRRRASGRRGLRQRDMERIRASGVPAAHVAAI